MDGLIFIGIVIVVIVGGTLVASLYDKLAVGKAAQKELKEKKNKLSELQSEKTSGRLAGTMSFLSGRTMQKTAGMLIITVLINNWKIWGAILSPSTGILFTSSNANTWRNGS